MDTKGSTQRSGIKLRKICEIFREMRLIHSTMSDYVMVQRKYSENVQSFLYEMFPKALEK